MTYLAALAVILGALLCAAVILSMPSLLTSGGNCDTFFYLSREKDVGKKSKRRMGSYLKHQVADTSPAHIRPLNSPQPVGPPTD